MSSGASNVWPESCCNEIFDYDYDKCANDDMKMIIIVALEKGHFSQDIYRKMIIIIRIWL